MTWTLQEIQAYRPLDYMPLLKLYEMAGLTNALPDARARYLAEEVLSLTPSDHDVLMRTAGIDGRATALRALEMMVESAHREKIGEADQVISVPL